ncbi:MAG: hypothetical protein GX129_04380 [Clostridiales bacterium]|jgi:asparagine synthase (glutamine-hydrolysing)|nr:hypothetical protein [Clostridiales bacterium]
MSAIWGTISFNNTISEDADSIMRSYYISNCKIDRSSFLMQSNFYFGCGIQHITQEAYDEILPVFDANHKLCFTADCLLDNRDELLELLSETRTSLPDGKLMLSAYLRWGIDCIKYFRGLFSFAVYDIEKNTIYLATDQVSSRCLYYYWSKEELTFSTLLMPLRLLHRNISYNQLYLKDFLTAPGLMPSIVSKETPFEQVFKLNPGTYLEITSKGIREVEYWTPSMPLTNCDCSSPEEYGTYFRALYESCIQDALRTDKNIGIALSSGLDSSSVGAIAANFLQKKNKKLYTYTYVPYEPVAQDKDKNKIHNEEEDVMKIVSMYPNMVPLFLNNDGKNCFYGITFGIDIMEIPYKAFGNLPSLFEIYDKASINSCKVVLSGQMGNSTVSSGYIEDILYDLYTKRKYLSFLKYLNSYCKTTKKSRKHAFKEFVRYFHNSKKMYSDNNFNYVPDNPFLKDTICDDYPIRERYASGDLSLYKGSLPVPRHLYLKQLGLKTPYTYIGEFETKAGLHYGLVLRDPTKDMRILSFCYHLPYHLFAYGGTPRWLIRSQSKDILPDDLRNNWLRYGIQNSDYHTRLIRDWDRLYPLLKESLYSSKILPYMNEEAVSDFFNNTKSALSAKNELDLKYLMIVHVLNSFLNLPKCIV